MSGGQLIDRIAARPPIREFVFIQPVGHARAAVRRDWAPGAVYDGDQLL